METSVSVGYPTQNKALTRPSGKFDGAEIITSFASLAFGAFVVAEAIAWWGFRTLAGWPGAIAAILAVAVLTFVFRDRMRTTNAVETIGKH